MIELPGLTTTSPTTGAEGLLPVQGISSSYIFAHPVSKKVAKKEINIFFMLFSLLTD
jgi:hypothetical protein